MTELRKRMIEGLQLRGLSERTQEAYVRAVRQLADHYIVCRHETTLPQVAASYHCMQIR